MKLLFCKKCGEYTMQKQCPKCNADTITPEPAKYSPSDKYGEQRRKYKKMQGEG
ncbi:MAG: RNA-protein complex protein Nop10 [archaeon]